MIHPKTCGCEQCLGDVIEELREERDEARAEVKRLQDDETLGSQIDRLADFIMREVPGEPSENEGAIDTAIRVMRRVKTLTMALDVATDIRSR